MGNSHQALALPFIPSSEAPPFILSKGRKGQKGLKGLFFLPFGPFWTLRTLLALSAITRLVVIVTWLAVVISRLVVVTMRLCRSALMVVAWRWAMWSACAVVSTSWRTCPALNLVVMHRTYVVVMVAWWNVYHNINLAWATRICAINIVCHCTADCHC